MGHLYSQVCHTFDRLRMDAMCPVSPACPTRPTSPMRSSAPRCTGSGSGSGAGAGSGAGSYCRSCFPRGGSSRVAAADSVLKWELLEKKMKKQRVHGEMHDVMVPKGCSLRCFRRLYSQLRLLTVLSSTEPLTPIRCRC